MSFVLSACFPFVLSASLMLSLPICYLKLENLPAPWVRICLVLEYQSACYLSAYQPATLVPICLLLECISVCYLRSPICLLLECLSAWYLSAYLLDTWVPICLLLECLLECLSACYLSAYLPATWVLICRLLECLSVGYILECLSACYLSASIHISLLGCLSFKHPMDSCWHPFNVDARFYRTYAIFA